VHDVLPGDYELEVVWYCRAANRIGIPCGTVAHAVHVPTPAQGGNMQAIDLGTFPLIRVNHLRPGEPAPDLELRLITGEMIKLSDFSVGLVLLHFTDIGWDPFAAESSRLQDVYRRFSGSEQFQVITANLCADAGLAQRYASERNFGWVQGVVKQESTANVISAFGVDRAANIFLLGPGGTILATAIDKRAMESTVAKALQEP